MGKKNKSNDCIDGLWNDTITLVNCCRKSTSVENHSDFVDVDEKTSAKSLTFGQLRATVMAVIYCAATKYL